MKKCNQYFFMWPLAAKTASKRFEYLFTRLAHMLIGILAHSSLHISFNWIKFLGSLSCTLNFNSRHRFSIGFRLGDWLGHSNKSISLSWNHARVAPAVCLGSLSCWNIQPRGRFKFSADFTRHLSRMPRYISGVHPSFYDFQSPRACRREATPKHYATASKLHSWDGILRVKRRVLLSPNTADTVPTKQLYFRLIRP